MEDQDEADDGIQITPDQLSPEALRNVIEEIVTRDGTDMVEGERKIEQVLGQLQRGQVELWYSESTRTCSVVRVERP